jgi:hypothetical protein
MTINDTEIKKETQRREYWIIVLFTFRFRPIICRAYTMTYDRSGWRFVRLLALANINRKIENGKRVPSNSFNRMKNRSILFYLFIYPRCVSFDCHCWCCCFFFCMSACCLVGTTRRRITVVFQILNTMCYNVPGPDVILHINHRSWEGKCRGKFVFFTCRRISRSSLLCLSYQFLNCEQQ